MEWMGVNDNNADAYDNDDDNDKLSFVQSEFLKVLSAFQRTWWEAEKGVYINA